MADLFVALLHYPVLDRNGRVVTSAVTSLDIHDISRSALTYGVRAMYLVHPVEQQRGFARSIIEHWKFGYGRSFDELRRQALELVHIVASLDDAISKAAAAGGRPLLVHTSARETRGMSVAALRRRLEGPNAPPAMILLGTGFGLAPEIREKADVELAPIRGPGDYNHLSVRAAAGIILDRLRSPDT